MIEGAVGEDSTRDLDEAVRAHDPARDCAADQSVTNGLDVTRRRLVVRSTRY